MRYAASNGSPDPPSSLVSLARFPGRTTARTSASRVQTFEPRRSNSVKDARTDFLVHNRDTLPSAHPRIAATRLNDPSDRRSRPAMAELGDGRRTQEGGDPRRPDATSRAARARPRLPQRLARRDFHLSPGIAPPPKRRDTNPDVPACMPVSVPLGVPLGMPRKVPRKVPSGADVVPPATASKSGRDDAGPGPNPRGANEGIFAPAAAPAPPTDLVAVTGLPSPCTCASCRLARAAARASPLT